MICGAKPRHHNPRVGGSSPSSATNPINALALVPIVSRAARQRVGVNLGGESENPGGRGWAGMKVTTADNTYTGKGGTKRD